MFALIFVLTSLLPVAFGDDPCCRSETACSCCRYCECPSAYADVLVRRVIDGDTIEVLRDNGGEPARVRMIGVDTPETVNSHTGVQEYGPEASDFVKKLLEGRRVRLAFERDRRDSFGRILAFVYLDGELINLKLAREGYGRYYSRFKFTIRPMMEFERAEREAREAKRGLWRDDRPRDDAEDLRSLPIPAGD